MKRSKVITAVIAIIAVVAAACVYGYVRSKPADEPEKPAVTKPENPTTPETPDDSNSGKPSDSKTDKPAVQPENPNPSGTESVTIYVPDEQGETLTPTGADAKVQKIVRVRIPFLLSSKKAGHSFPRLLIRKHEIVQ